MRACEHCGEEFNPSRPERRFCSRGCHVESHRTSLTCLTCGKQYFRPKWLVKQGIDKYCSIKCAGVAKRVDEPLSEDVICEHCGKQFRVLRCKAEDRRFCCRRCAYDFRILPDTIHVPCVFCGKPFLRSKTMEKLGLRSCSRECQIKGQAAKVKKRIRSVKCQRCGIRFKYDPTRSEGMYCSFECQRGTRLTFSCLHCNKEYSRPPSEDVSSFCSKECQSLHQIGENSPAWTGGRILAGNNSINVVTKEFHKNAKGERHRVYRGEHRLIAEKIIGRPLKKRGEPMIHLNGDNTDNRPENLYVFPNWVELGNWIGGNIVPTKSNLQDLRRQHEELT